MRSARALLWLFLGAALLGPLGTSLAARSTTSSDRQVVARRSAELRLVPRRQIRTRRNAMQVAKELYGHGALGERMTVAVLGSAVPEAEIPAQLMSNLVKLGQHVAKAGGILVTGACPGVPAVAQRAAFEAGGITVGISPAKSLKDHLTAFKMSTTGMSIVQWTGTGPGTGFIEREAPLIDAADILVIASGRSGTMGELTAGMYAPKVLAVLDSSGGIAGHAREKIIPHIGTGNAVVVYDADPVRLMEKAKVALAKLKASQPERPLVLPVVDKRVKMMHGMTKLEHKSLVTRPVYSLFTAERGMSDLDRAHLQRLATLIGTPQPGEEKPLVLGPARSGLTAEMFEVARRAGAETLGVSGANSKKEHAEAGYGTNGFDRIELTGKGTGVGAFAAIRPVVDRSKIVFVAGGDHETLAGVVFASYQRNTILAVLVTDGMTGKLEHEITKTYDKPAQATVIYDTDPDRLYARARKAAGAIAGSFREAYIAAE